MPLFSIHATKPLILKMLAYPVNFADDNNWKYLEGRKKMNSLKKAVVIFGMSVFTLFFLSSAVWGKGLKLGFKFTGGINYQLLGDADAFLRGLKAQADDYVEKYSGDTLEQFIFPLASHFGYEFDTDAILYLTPQFGISLGIGYTRGGTIFGLGNQILSVGSSGKEKWTNDLAASAVPIKVGVYYNFSSEFTPQGKSSSYLFGGIGLYQAKFSYSSEYTYQTTWSDYSFEAKASGIGFYAGFGGENWINPNFAFIYEISGRYAKIGGFTGTYQADVNGTMSSGSGTVYYYERLDSNVGNWYPNTWMFGAAPSGPTLNNVREANIDFSGVGLKIGIKVNF
ncbi:MAG: hypothetical protein KJ768_00880 [Acidobacteria bacterium]|nr:hypothetical protein [Acidobacteriota bacterium]